MLLCPPADFRSCGEEDVTSARPALGGPPLTRRARVSSRTKGQASDTRVFHDRVLIAHKIAANSLGFAAFFFFSACGAVLGYFFCCWSWRPACVPRDENGEL